MWKEIYLNAANSMGFTSIRRFTITEHNEKNKEDNVAKTMPKYGQFNWPLSRASQYTEFSLCWETLTN